MEYTLYFLYSLTMVVFDSLAILDTGVKWYKDYNLDKANTIKN